MKKEIAITEDKIFELYSDYILTHGEQPKSVYQFAKENKFEEQKFYTFFTSFDQVEKHILVKLFSRSIELAEDVNNAEGMTSKEKLLNVYYIFFENLTMNRSLVLMILGKHKLPLSKNLLSLKKIHQEYIKTLDFSSWEILEKAKEDIKNTHEQIRENVLWLHLVSAIDFWKNDSSPDFEKTDIFIEKTIDTGFELMDNEPLRKVLDLGKFLWKEKFNRS
ncbi:TetR/AcrR family transcriptional regulator [Flavobacterium sp. NST-5]|uniref:TetR/AcrR family transcriptional regulator n=1 Tax=Flavobacterium ichthyis TaxID=2698827 RepID=A0ABW9Z6Z5_9FLAO|nr:TetR family transcriptional regulator C-terminal domain-containing protein [Flavobacterium ichthyis]NBL64434.1 TetR/AcrR family transcriptional regulator [Flavobacterium ichthyis]